MIRYTIRRFYLYLFRPGNGSPSATNVVVLDVVVVVVVVVVVSAKALSFHNRSSSNFAYTLLTMFCRIAPCAIFNLSPN